MTLSSKFLGLLAMALAAAPAWAAPCPSAADLVAGIRVTRADGVATTVRATADPVVLRVRTDRPDGGHVTQAMAWGFFDLETLEGSAGEAQGSIDYGVIGSKLPHPSPESRFTFPRVRYLGEGEPFEVREVYEMGPWENVTLAGCPFRAFEITQTQDDPVADGGDEPVEEGEPARAWLYLMDLGFAVDLWRTSPEGRAPAADIAAIEAVP
ncbi:hypothetical protein [Rubellimicrobium arenae]|uniref:hypothetical protein n=1 Tax=Rubellimicrobium arenae TaxID=2817372 RepID=UPI001B30365C|nr:hypothetical protein [Rubellimicrobium arenae]